MTDVIDDAVAEVIISDKIYGLWEDVRKTCNRVLQQANMYGFGLMHIPDPNVKNVAQTLNFVVVPMLDKLADKAEINPELGLKIVNMRQYALHLREIAIALGTGDELKFDRVVEMLRKEPML
jgi:hypothetical protein